MKRTSLVLLSLLLLAFMVASLAYSQTARRGMKPMTDGVSHTSGEQGKWVKGCSTGQACNMGVGNLGPAGTYHWE